MQYISLNKQSITTLLLLYYYYSIIIYIIILYYSTIGILVVYGLYVYDIIDKYFF